MRRKLRRIPELANADASGFWAGGHTLEPLESRRMLAAHIVGSNTSYLTIQAAVNAATAGATITVDAGTYPEKVTISQPMTIQGAMAGVDARQANRANGSGLGESILTGALSNGVTSAGFVINASDVTLDGFIVQGETNSSTQVSAGIIISPNQFGTHVLNNIVQNNVSGLFLANSSGTDPAVIQYNVFRNNNNSGQNGGRGIYTDQTIFGTSLTNVLIDSNSFVNNYGGNGTTGLEAACAFEAGVVGLQSNIHISNNTMTGNGKAVLFFNTTGVFIVGNTITTTQDQYSGTLRFEGNIQNVTILYNNIHDNTGPAVAIDSKGVPGDSSGFVVNFNNLYSNNSAYSIPITLVYYSDNYVGALDARNNWWGNASGPSGNGPGTGDAASAGMFQPETGLGWKLVSGGNLLYSPWSTALNTQHPIEIDNTSINDVTYLRKNVDGVHLDAWLNNAAAGVGTPTIQFPLAGATGLTVHGGGGTDNLTLDFAGGSPLLTTNVIEDLGGALSLSILGTTGNDTLSLNDTTLSWGVGPGALTAAIANVTSVSYTDQGANDNISVLGSIPLTLITGNGSDTLNVGTGANATVNFNTSNVNLTINGTGNTALIIGSGNPNLRTFAIPVDAGGSISGTVFNDANANASRESRERGLAGRELFLDLNQNGILDSDEPTAVTGPDGHYSFNGLMPGHYIVEEATPAGWRATTASSYTLTLSAGQRDAIHNFGQSNTAVISGVVFNDVNGNQAVDNSEHGLRDWIVFLDTNNNGRLDKGEISTFTDSNGKYSFGVSAGTFHVCQVLRRNARRTTAAASFIAKATAGQSIFGLNFGDR